MKIICCDNYDAMSRVSAEIIAEAVKAKPDCVLGLATGSSPIGIYKNLAEQCANKQLSFKDVKSVNLDEYCGLDITSDQSYIYFMNENLFSHIDMPAESHNLPNGTNPDAAAECARYDALIHSLGGIDLQLLGIGINGHIGFNEPSDEFVMECHRVELSESTIAANARFFASKADVPHYAYTIGMEPIVNARRVLLIANGKNKAKALYDMAFGPVTPAVPASVLQTAKGEVTIVGDRDALSEIITKHPGAIIKK